jgi:hypothetical protein
MGQKTSFAVSNSLFVIRYGVQGDFSQTLPQSMLKRVLPRS